MNCLLKLLVIFSILIMNIYSSPQNLSVHNNIEDIENNECLLCGDDGAVSLHCSQNHKYHIKCISKWVKQSPTCPYCSKNLEIQSLSSLNHWARKSVRLFNTAATCNDNVRIVQSIFAEISFCFHHVLENLYTQKNQQGNTLLHIALEKGYIKVAKYLIKNMINLTLVDAINAQNKDGNTPLHLAVKKGLFPIVQALIVLAPADVDGYKNSEINNDGDSLFHLLAATRQKQSMQVLHLLRENFIIDDDTLTNKQGETIQDIALKSGYSDDEISEFFS